MNRFISLLVVLGVAACGKIPDPPASGPATLIAVHDDGLPVVGAMAVHLSSGGVLIDEGATGVDGKVTFTVTDGDIVHVGWNEGDPTSGAASKRLFTVIAIEPNDVIRLNNRSTIDQSELTTVAVQVAPLPPGATSADLFAGGCGTKIDSATQTTVSLPVRKDCVDGAGLLTVVGAIRDASGVTVASSVVVDQAVPPVGQPLVMPAWRPPVTAKVTFALTNPPPGSALNFVDLNVYRHGVRFEQFEGEGGPQGPASLNVQTAPGYADAIEHAARVAFPNDNEPTKIDGVVVLISKEAYANDAGASYVADFNESLPRLFGAKYDANLQAFDWGVQAIDDAQTERLNEADLVAIILFWTEASAPGVTHQWTVLAPGYAGAPLQMYLEGAEAFAPPMSSTIFPALVTAFALDVIEGYQDMKNRFGTGFFDSIDSLPTFKGSATLSGDPH